MGVESTCRKGIQVLVLLVVFLLPVLEVRVVLMSESACASFGASPGVSSAIGAVLVLPESAGKKFRQFLPRLCSEPSHLILRSSEHTFSQLLTKIY